MFYPSLVILSKYVVVYISSTTSWITDCYTPTCSCLCGLWSELVAHHQ